MRLVLLLGVTGANGVRLRKQMMRGLYFRLNERLVDFMSGTLCQQASMASVNTCARIVNMRGWVDVK